MESEIALLIGGTILLLTIWMGGVFKLVAEREGVASGLVVSGLAGVWLFFFAFLVLTDQVPNPFG